jgi:hypothetical protein
MPSVQIAVLEQGSKIQAQITVTFFHKFGGEGEDRTPDRVRARCRGFADHPITTLGTSPLKAASRESDASKRLLPARSSKTLN